MRRAEQVRNYFVSLALYIQKFRTDAIVAFLKKSLPDSGITLGCGPDKIDGGRRYIILAAVAVATGTPKPLYRSLILLKHTQQQASCAFRTFLSTLGDKMQNIKQASEGYDTFGGMLSSYIQKPSRYIVAVGYLCP
jgi:hypothetical protein